MLESQPMTTPTFWQATQFWFKLGCISFGGPAGQIAIMQRELVEQRRWISPARFSHALNYCMVLPGPEAQQLATYIGWLMHGTRGALVAGGLFVLPAWVLMLGLSWLFMAQGQSPWLDGVLWGLNAAVVALVLHAVWRLASKVLLKPIAGLVLMPNRPLVAVFVGLAAIGFVAGVTGWLSFLWVVALAAGVGWWLGQGANAAPPKALAHGDAAYAIDDQTPTPDHAKPSRPRLYRVLAVSLALWALPFAALALARGWADTLTQMAWLFTKAALVTFGGAYAVLPYVTDMAVNHHAWLSASQMMHGLALGESTPGPLILVLAYVGFAGAWIKQVLGADAQLWGAVLGSWVAVWFTFLPSFAFILAGGPFVERSRSSLQLAAPLAAISAAVVGVIASLAYIFIAANLTNTATTFAFGIKIPLWVLSVGLSALAYAALHKFQRSALEVVLVCAALGWVLA
jgi:chromate transporter